MGLYNFAYEEDKANTKEIPSYNDNFVARNGHPYDLLNTSSESSSERNSTSSTGFPKPNTHKPNTVIYRSEEALSSMFMVFVVNLLFFVFVLSGRSCPLN